MPKFKLRRDDEVVVITGKNKGKRGKILKVDTERSRVFVEGVNMIKRHQRANPANPNAEVGVIEREGSVHISNVALADPKDGKPTRVTIQRDESGNRKRIAKRSGTEIE